jgi:hypothetical protein
MAVDPYALTTLVNAKAYMGITVTTWDDLLESLINSSSARIERYIGMDILARDRIEFYDAAGCSVIALRHRPVNSCRFVGHGSRSCLMVASTEPTDLAAVVQVVENGVNLVRSPASGEQNVTSLLEFGANVSSTDVATAISAVTGFSATASYAAPARYLHRTGPIDVTDAPAYLTMPDRRASGYRIDSRAGLVWMPEGWQDGWPEDTSPGFGASEQVVVIDSNCGYVTVPYDIEQTCIEMVAARFRSRGRDETVQSESLGDYSYSSGGTQILNEILEERLAAWKEIR